ncbi:MAG: DNA polymerase III subunit delta [Isosphaeraceae bacterium]
MKALEWLRDPARQPLKPVYVIHGDDVYLRRESCAAAVRAVLGDAEDNPGIRRFAGSEATLADVLDELRTLPFFSRRRLVVVEDADTFVTRNRKDLEEYVKAPSTSGFLVLLVKSWPSTTNLARLVAAGGLTVDCTSPGEKDLVPWLVAYAGKQEAHLEADAARLLLELVGPETGLLTAEVDKLVVFVGQEGRIRRDDVARMVEAGRIETVWKVLDEATSGQAAEALRHLDNLIAAGEHPIKLVAALATTLQKVHHAGRLRAARLPLEEACRIAGIRDFAVDKTRRQHAHLGPSRVDQLPAMLLKVDLDLKGNSPLDPRAVLEDLLIRLSVPRKD